MFFMNAVPKCLLGGDVGAIFSFVMMGMAIAPAILGLDQDSAPDPEAGLNPIFLFGAVTIVISLHLVITIPDVSIDVEVADHKVPAMY